MFSRKYDRRQAPWKMSRLPRFSCPPFGTAEASVLGLLERSQWGKNGKKRLATEEFFEEQAGEGWGVVVGEAVCFEGSVGEYGGTGIFGSWKGVENRFVT